MSDNTQPYVIRIDVEQAVRWSVELATSPEAAFELALARQNIAELRKELRFRVYSVCSQLLEARAQHQYPQSSFPHMGEVRVVFAND